tara:strand:+ start:19898 stop:20725 length:828 start_codon:yes stop_codon:yes gene_type:complete
MFKHFEEGQINTYKFKAHKTHSLTQADVTRHQFLSASSNEVSKSYYEFSRINFYLSGSDVAQSNPLFNTYPTVGNRFDGQGIFLSKFHNTGSVVSISQSLFGEEIKKGSFVLDDTTTGAKIVDDSNGNLYATNATRFEDSGASISSSANYVGNIFYDLGVFTITETGSFSATKTYADVTDGNYSLSFKGSLEISTYEFVCRTEPNELNETQNITIYKKDGLGHFKDNLTSSYWPNYISEVGLYDEEGDLMAISRMSKPIPKSTELPMRFFLRMDY